MGPRTLPFAMLAAVLMLSACGSQDNRSDGAEIAAPRAAALPDYAPAYPGSTEITRVSGSSDESGAGILLVLSTADPVDKVIAFYDEKAREHGVSASMVQNSGDSRVRMFGEEASPRGAMIVVSPADDGTTRITLTAGESWEEEAPPPPKTVTGRLQ